MARVEQHSLTVYVTEYAEQGNVERLNPPTVDWFNCWIWEGLIIDWFAQG